MNRYYLKRTVRVFVTIYLVATFTFGLIRLLPGGPFTQLRLDLYQQGLSRQEVEARIETVQNIDPNTPLWEQYIDYMGAAVNGNLGRSIYHSEPVVDILAQAVPWTVFIIVVSTLLMFAIGIVLGALQAYWEGSSFDTGLTIGWILLMSIPFYVFAILLVYVVAYQFGWLPTGGKIGSTVGNELSVAFVISALEHALLPIIAYTIGEIGGQALSMRANSIHVLGEDYIRVARLRGLPDRLIATKYVARNAILPMYTGFLLLLGFRLGGTIILEEIFSYPGLGYYLIQSLNNNDYPLMMGTFMIITIAVVVAVFIADLTYGLIDPRITTGDTDETF